MREKRAEGRRLPKGTFWQEIEAIKAEAKRLCSKNPDGSFVCKAQDRAIELREWSKRHGPYLNDSEIRRCLHEARAELAGSVKKPSDPPLLPLFCRTLDQLRSQVEMEGMEP